MRTPRPATHAPASKAPASKAPATKAPAGKALAAVLAAALLIGACQPVGRQATDGGYVPPPANAENAAQATVQTDWGPLGPSDRDLVVKVRQGVLWEISAGRQAQRRAARPATRRALGEIARRDPKLDELVRGVAARLKVPLPNEPSTDQQSWISEITGKSGNDYDKTAVARMRTAQGWLYAELAGVRAGTRNTLVRQFCRKAEPFLDANMKSLEGTGFVTGDALPDPPAVTGAPAPAAPGGRVSPAPAATSVLPGGR